MTKVVFFLQLFLFLFVVQGKSQTFKDLPVKYSTYEQATRKIKAASWAFTEVRMTPESSWIKRISYYTCDGKAGFLMILTDSKEYIFAEYPRSMWVEFKGASSKGSYYNENIRGRFQFSL